MRSENLYGFQLFEDVAQWARLRGYGIVSPHDLDVEQHVVDITAHIEGEADGFRRVFTEVTLKPHFTIEDALTRDFKALLDCDGIMLLPGWSRSMGALAECRVALWTGKSVVSVYGEYPHFTLVDPRVTHDILDGMVISRTRLAA